MALISLFQEFVTEKVNGFFITHESITKTFEAQRCFCSYKLIVFLYKTKVCDNLEKRLQQDSYRKF